MPNLRLSAIFANSDATCCSSVELCDVHAPGGKHGGTWGNGHGDMSGCVGNDGCIGGNAALTGGGGIGTPHGFVELRRVAKC